MVTGATSTEHWQSNAEQATPRRTPLTGQSAGSQFTRRTGARSQQHPPGQRATLPNGPISIRDACGVQSRRSGMLARRMQTSLQRRPDP
mmetsp:Transcript_13044/g.22547  ORF Transcript_13044/g.22547 Transcript_13044/m.22547 type:complete len:89 (+) Transcript_13044:614-880(+)